MTAPVTLRWHKWRLWLVNIDFYFARYQWCNGYWFCGVTVGGRWHKCWSGKPK